MNELTLQMLKAMKPHSIIAQGEAIDSPEGINMTNSGRMLRWIAVTGGAYDWAIYCHFSDMPYEQIRRVGDKVYGKEHIGKLVPCTDEAFGMYRY